MNRRSLLKWTAALPFLSVVASRWSMPALGAPSSVRYPARRVRPTDPAWPSAADWERLRRQVAGNLINVEPLLAACRMEKNSVSCRAVVQSLRNPYYIGDQAAGTQTSGWLDGWTSAPSAYAVAARTTRDVAAAVTFAREHNLRLVVKGGGHSYQGTSNAPDSLLIWTRPMHSIVMHDAFVPRGYAGRHPPVPAVTIEAGAMWMDVYNAVTTRAGRYVQGGGCATVGVAGLIQSGGFGSFSKNYGTAAAGLLEAEVVTADGRARIANARTYPDLFWALKGGGGSSLGVVTRITLRTRELPALLGSVSGTIKARSDAAYRRLIGRFISFYRDSLLNPHWGEQATFRPDNTLVLAMSVQGLDRRQADDVWRPFLHWMAQSPADFVLASAPTIRLRPGRHYWDAGYLKKNLPRRVSVDDRPGAPETHVWWASNQEEVGVFIHGYESAWLPASLLQPGRRSRFADALFAGSRHWEVMLHFNKGLAGAPDDAVAAARDTAMNPAVLDAFALALVAGGGPPAYPGMPGSGPDLTTARRNAGAIKRAMNELKKLVPNPGSYVSEGNFFDRSWQRSHWGSNYPRLRAVKHKYDPAGLFFVHHGAGSEEWSPDGFTRL